MTSPDRAPGADDRARAHNASADGPLPEHSWTDDGIAAPLDHLDRALPRAGGIPRPRPGNPDRLDLRARCSAAGLLVLILVAVAVIVFWPGPPDPGGQTALHRYLDQAHGSGLPGWISFDLVENAANVLMFAPLGLLGSLALRRHNYLVVLYAALVSGFIELTQLVLLPDRVASLDDVLANTAGAFVGLLISVPALRRRIRRRRRYLKGRSAAADSPRRVNRAGRL